MERSNQHGRGADLLRHVSPTLAAAALFAGVLLPPATALAHGGGLDSQGCHTSSRTGDYHCHRASSPAPFARRSASARTAFRH